MRVLKKLANFSFSPDETFLLFTDGSLKYANSDSPLIGIGADLRNKDGKKVLFYSEQLSKDKFPTWFNHNDFEKISLFNSLDICLKQGIKKIIINTDDQGMDN